MSDSNIYGSQLSHASSAGGTYCADEDWTILSWYGEIHHLTIEERTKVGVGMSPSQKEIWVKVSKSAYDQGIFPESYFDAEHIILPDVDNITIWLLLHEITRETYVDDLAKGVETKWMFVGGFDSTTWQVIFYYPDYWTPDVVKHTHHGCYSFFAAGDNLRARRAAVEQMMEETARHW